MSSKSRIAIVFLSCVLPTFVATRLTPALAAAGTDPWQCAGRNEGLSAERIFSLVVSDRGLWVGTEKGLFVQKEGSPFVKFPLGSLEPAVVLSLEYDRMTGDLWVGTFDGLARVNESRVLTYDQFNSGLANNVVYGLEMDETTLWAATAAGLSRFDPLRGRWTIFNEKNTPMKEIWCYSISATPEYVYVGVWGSGILELNKQTGIWKIYRDPDGEPEVDLFKDDGPISDVTSSVHASNGEVWQSTYFGLSRYDGRHWRNFYAGSSTDLPSNFVNSVHRGLNLVWACTDRGLTSFDGKTWSRFLQGKNVYTVVFEGEDVIAGTDGGLYRGHITALRSASERSVSTESGGDGQ